MEKQRENGADMEREEEALTRSMVRETLAEPAKTARLWRLARELRRAMRTLRRSYRRAVQCGKTAADEWLGDNYHLCCVKAKAPSPPCATPTGQPCADGEPVTYRLFRRMLKEQGLPGAEEIRRLLDMADEERPLTVFELAQLPLCLKAALVMLAADACGAEPEQGEPVDECRGHWPAPDGGAGFCRHGGGAQCGGEAADRGSGRPVYPHGRGHPGRLSPGGGSQGHPPGDRGRGGCRRRGGAAATAPEGRKRHVGHWLLDEDRRPAGAWAGRPGLHPGAASAGRGFPGRAYRQPLGHPAALFPAVGAAAPRGGARRPHGPQAPPPAPHGFGRGRAGGGTDPHYCIHPSAHGPTAPAR